VGPFRSRARKWLPSWGSGFTIPYITDLLPAGPRGHQHRDRGSRPLPAITSALVFENVTVRPSPYWLQARFERPIGLNPINNIVDMTNFIMSELAQPMHAFDAGLIHGRHPSSSAARIRAKPSAR